MSRRNKRQRRRSKLHVERLERRQLLDAAGLEFFLDDLRAGDLDGDGLVGFSDFLILSDNFGGEVTDPTLGDLDGDGRVGFPDFLVLSDNFGKDLNPLRPVVPPDHADESADEQDFIQTHREFLDSINADRLDGELPFQNIPDDAEVIFNAVLQAGSLTGNPADSPSNRIDPNFRSSPFGGVGSLEVVHPTLGAVICTGTLISPTHVLTAGHCFDIEVDGKADEGLVATFYLNHRGDYSSVHNMKSVQVHPDFGGFTVSGANDDLAIMELDAPVPAGTPTYQITIRDMANQEEIEMVGYGQSGQGDEGFSVLPTFTQKRVGRNVVDLFVVDDNGTPKDEIYFFDFDAPDGSDGFFAGPSLGNDIESTVGGGDSGGPAFIAGARERVLIGVNTFNWELPPSIPEAGFFGSLGGGIVLPSYLDWIHGISPESLLVNRAPSFDPGVEIRVLEDSGNHAEQWAINVFANDPGQQVSFEVHSNTNPGLFSVQPTVDQNGFVRFRSAPDQHGTATLKLRLVDDGGTEYGGIDTSGEETLTITVLSINDPPSFELSSNSVEVDQDSGPQNVANFARSFDPGPNEFDQNVDEFVIEDNDNPGLFSAGPEIDNTGRLTFTPAAGVSGEATISVRVDDTGPSQNGGTNQSDVASFVITVVPPDVVIPPPEPGGVGFDLTQNIEVNEDSGDFRMSNFLVNIGSDVSGFLVSDDSPALFATAPDISVDGELTFRPAADAHGVANVDVLATSAGGDLSALFSFTITVNSVNDAPTVTVGGDVTVKQNSGFRTIPGFATIGPGNASESGQSVRFDITTTNPVVFASLPLLTPNGTLSFSFKPNTIDSSSVIIRVIDDGGTENGGIDTSTIRFTLRSEA